MIPRSKTLGLGEGIFFPLFLLSLFSWAQPLGPSGGWGRELWTACDQITLDLSDPRGWRREPFARIAPWPERGREGPDLWRAGRGVGYRHALPEGVATPSCRPWGLGLKEGRIRIRPGRVGAVPGRLRELAPPEVWPRRNRPIRKSTF